MPILTGSQLHEVQSHPSYDTYSHTRRETMSDLSKTSNPEDLAYVPDPEELAKTKNKGKAGDDSSLKSPIKTISKTL